MKQWETFSGVLKGIFPLYFLVSLLSCFVHFIGVFDYSVGSVHAFMLSWSSGEGLLDVNSSILMMVSFKGNSRSYTLGCKYSLTIFYIYIFCSLVWKLSSRPQYAGGNFLKSLCKDAGIEGRFTNLSLRATTATRGMQKGIPGKFVMEITEHRAVRSLPKYQHPDTSSEIEISKKFDCCQASVTVTRVSYFWKGVNKTWNRGRWGRSERLLKIFEGI